MEWGFVVNGSPHPTAAERESKLANLVQTGALWKSSMVGSPDARCAYRLGNDAFPSGIAPAWSWVVSHRMTDHGFANLLSFDMAGYSGGFGEGSSHAA
jgi:hypothetical protein